MRLIQRRPMNTTRVIQSYCSAGDMSAFPRKRVYVDGTLTVKPPSNSAFSMSSPKSDIQSSKSSRRSSVEEGDFCCCTVLAHKLCKMNVVAELVILIPLICIKLQFWVENVHFLWFRRSTIAVCFRNVRHRRVRHPLASDR